MKRNALFSVLTVALAFTCIVATGCKSKSPTPITQIPGRTVPVPEPGPTPPIDTTKTKPTDLLDGTPLPPRGSHDGWVENAEMFKSETVYFDFDSAVIKTSEKPKIETVATYLKGNAANAVKVEGHCDERGTEEYNRSLGDRRALAVREELMRLGLAPDRIDTVTFGKDRPADTAHNDAAWKKNRRGVFVVLSPPK